MLFIDLTEYQARPDGHHALVRMNAHAIMHITEAPTRDGASKITFANTYVTVREAPEEVLALIERKRLENEQAPKWKLPPPLES